MNFSLQWWKLRVNNKPKQIIDVSKLYNSDIQQQFKAVQNKYVEAMIEDEDPDDSWNRIATTCKDVATGIVGVQNKIITII